MTGAESSASNDACPRCGPAGVTSKRQGGLFEAEAEGIGLQEQRPRQDREDLELVTRSSDSPGMKILPDCGRARRRIGATRRPTHEGSLFRPYSSLHAHHPIAVGRPDRDEMHAGGVAAPNQVAPSLPRKSWSACIAKRGSEFVLAE